MLPALKKKVVFLLPGKKIGTVKKKKKKRKKEKNNKTFMRMIFWEVL